MPFSADYRRLAMRCHTAVKREALPRRLHDDHEGELAMMAEQPVTYIHCVT